MQEGGRGCETLYLNRPVEAEDSIVWKTPFFYLTHINWFKQSHRHQDLTQFKTKESKRKELTLLQQSLPRDVRSVSMLYSVITTAPS